MNILFIRDHPDQPDLRFVEIEDDNGHSINAGTWSERDGYVILTLPDANGTGDGHVRGGKQ